MSETLTRAGFDLDLRQMQAHEASLAMVLMARGTVTIEHKRDFGTVRTGNLFVEYAQTSGPSGIATTEAHTWAFEYDEGHWLLVPTTRLRQLCRVAYREKRRARGGDYNRQHGVLLPVRWLVPPYVRGGET